MCLLKFILILVLALSCGGWGSQSLLMSGGVEAGVACTLSETIGTSEDYAHAIHDYSTSTYGAWAFRITVPNTITKVEIIPCKTGSPTAETEAIQLFLCDDDGTGTHPVTNPEGNCTVGSSMYTYDMGSGERCSTWQSFTFGAGKALTTGTTYHVVSKSNGYGANYQVAYSHDDFYETWDTQDVDSDGLGWSNAQSDTRIYMRLYYGNCP